MPCTSFLRAALLCGAAFLPFPALAAEDADAAGQAIIVIGQQQRPIEIAPRGLSVSLGDEQFAAVNATNTEDLMKYAPDFFVRTRFPGDSNGVPGFRGTHSIQSARALVMVDGFVVSNFLGNSFNFAPKWGVVGPGEVRQFDIVYGPYSARYAGNSMGGVVNITTRDPERTEAFVRVQLLSQPYRQFGTDATYRGWSGEAGIGLKQKDGPWSLRLSGRHFRNDGQPMTFLGLSPLRDTDGKPILVADAPDVTGAIVDPKQVEASAAGTGLENIPAGSLPPGQIPVIPGAAATPIFAAQSPAAITQDQVKLKVGYDDGAVTGQLLFAYWHNEDRQDAPDCYLRDGAGNVVCDGTVRIGAQSYTASGANFARTLRDEFLLGGKIAVSLGGDWTARLALSTYQIVRSDAFQSNGYTNGQTGGPGSLASAGPTGWVTADASIERKGEALEAAFGLSGSYQRTDSVISTLPNWQSKSGAIFGNRTFGKTRILSGWGEAVAHLSPAVSVTAGLRYDHWYAYDGGIRTAAATGLYPTRQEGALSPKLSGQVDLPGGTRVQLSLAAATRFPTVGELFQGTLLSDGTFNRGFDPGLKPERSIDANLLLARKIGPVRLTGSFFYQRVRNTIFQYFGLNQNGLLVSNYKNIDLTRQYGVEGIIETQDWPMRGMSMEANAAWIDSRTLRNSAAPAAEGVLFPRIPRWRINGTVRQDLGRGVQGSVGFRYASRPNTDIFGRVRGDTFGFTSELFQLDARVNWQATGNLRLSAGVNNITNDRAWVFHPYPQRNFLLEAEWRL
ncbi:MAG TPA: TonB-dependent receptor [Sphingobium sp.]|nr:TonB-dependent receptor [Sphingobium sp.]